METPTPAQSLPSNMATEKAEDQISIEERLFSNDLVMCKIIEFVSHNDRKNIELVCRRMYLLSMRTPCIFKEKLHLTIFYFRDTFCPVVNATMYIELFNENLKDDYAIVRGTKRTCEKPDFASVFEKYGRRFRRDIRRINLRGQVDKVFIEVFNNVFTDTTEIHCEGFTDEAVEYLKSEGCSASLRLKKLGMLGLYKTENYEEIVPFKNLKQIFYNPRQPKGLTKLIDKLEQNDRIIDILHISNDPLIHGDMQRLNNRFRSFKYDCNTLFEKCSVDKVAQLKKITKLKLTFRDRQDANISTLLRKCNFLKLKSAKLNNILFTRAVFAAIEPDEEPNLTKLRLQNCMCERGSTVLLSSIFPKSLRTLKIIFSHIQYGDLTAIPDVCPYLDSFHFLPLNFDGFNADVKLRYTKIFIEMIPLLANLKKLVTIIPMIPRFLEYIVNFRTQLVKADLIGLGLNVERFKQTMKDNNIKLVSMVELRYLNGKVECKCGTWSISLVFPKRYHRSNKKIDLSLASCQIPDCSCKSSNYLPVGL